MVDFVLSCKLLKRGVQGGPLPLIYVVIKKWPYNLGNCGYFTTIRGDISPLIITARRPLCTCGNLLKQKLVGGFTPFEKYARRTGSFPQGSG